MGQLSGAVDGDDELLALALGGPILGCPVIDDAAHGLLVKRQRAFALDLRGLLVERQRGRDLPIAIGVVGVRFLNGLVGRNAVAGGVDAARHVDGDGCAAGFLCAGVDRRRRLGIGL